MLPYLTQRTSCLLAGLRAWQNVIQSDTPNQGPFLFILHTEPYRYLAKARLVISTLENILLEDGTSNSGGAVGKHISIGVASS
jgi:hypothetical protein